MSSLQVLVMAPRWSWLCWTSITSLFWPGGFSTCLSPSPGTWPGRLATTHGTQVTNSLRIAPEVPPMFLECFRISTFCHFFPPPRKLCGISEGKHLSRPNNQPKHHLSYHGVLGVSSLERLTSSWRYITVRKTTMMRRPCVSFPSLQETSAEDFLRHWPHGLSELGPGPVPVHRLGHVLLLHLEGDQIHGKGGWETLIYLVILVFTEKPHWGWHLVFIFLFSFLTCLFLSPLIYLNVTACVCVCIGGLLHCNLPLSDADCAVDQRTHPAWCWDRHPVLPLPRPGTTCRPTGNLNLSIDMHALIDCLHWKQKKM